MNNCGGPPLANKDMVPSTVQASQRRCLLDDAQTVSTLKVYVAAISSWHVSDDNDTAESQQMV